MEIECSFREYGPLEPSFPSETDKKKLGRYEGGSLCGNFGDKKWSVASTIVTSISLNKLKSEGLTEEEIVKRCVNFLNKKPYRARKKPYGDLECRFFVFGENEISVSLVTDDRNNKNFWGRGAKNAGKVPGKRGRPRKKK